MWWERGSCGEKEDRLKGQGPKVSQSAIWYQEKNKREGTGLHEWKDVHELQTSHTHMATNERPVVAAVWKAPILHQN